MIDSMFQESTDTALDDDVRRPRSVVLKPQPFSWSDVGKAPFQGIGGGVAKSIAFGAELAGAFGQVAGAYPEMFGGQLSQQQRMEAETARQKLYQQGVDYSNEAGDTFRTRAKDILPDAQTTHASAQVVAGLADFATRAVGYTVTLGPLGPAAMGGDAGLEEADRLKQQGVDLPTRTKAGTVAGVLNAAAVAAPLTGATAASRFVKGVAVGEGTIVGQSLAEREILRAAGYDKIADTFDPLDPVALALGVVPGALGAKFGKPKVRTEADVKKYAALTPEEQTRSDAYERSPTNLAELQRAIKDEKRPDVRALLEAEFAKQSKAAGEHGVTQALAVEPDLVPAARVAQVAEALEATRLTPDDMLVARDEHLSAVELAADQMGRGESVEVANTVHLFDSPQEAGTVRLFGAGEVRDQAIKLTTDLEAARAAADRTGAAVHYMDLPADHPALVRPTAPEAGLVPHATVELTPEVAGQLLQRLRSDAPRQTASAAEQLRATREPPQPRAGKAAAPAKPEAAAKPRDAPKAAPSGDGEGKAAPSVAKAAETAAAFDPEMMVQLEGMDAPMRVGELLAKVQEEARQDTLAGKLLQVAAECDLRS